jgi:RNA polymerase sigma-70 factor (ECF subfamily)
MTSPGDGRVAPSGGETFDLVLDAAQLGAGWARTRLYELLAPAVAGYLRAQGMREAEDMTSEVFLAVFTRLARFGGTEGQFRSWVFTIAHHKVVDDRRRRSRRPEPDPLDAAHEHVAAVAAAEDEALGNLGGERVRALLDNLTADQRDVLALRILADLSIEHVAGVLGKPPGSVKALQHRALEALRRQLEREGVSK